MPTVPRHALRIEALRGSVIESVHRVSAAVVDDEGRLVASAGNPDFASFLRSAAKPFQAIPLVEDGAIERWSITSEELALACASHNSETRQVDLVRGFLERIGCTESDLACGPHRPLSEDLAIADNGPRRDQPESARMSAAASNCSGKHTGMLALARHHGWPTKGYHVHGHPVQTRCTRAISEWTGVSPEAIGMGIDGCGVVCYAVPMRAAAVAFARLLGTDQRIRPIVGAMRAHPDLIAGRGRLCTALMQSYPMLAKVGADGVYGATLLDRGVGIALKVEDGHSKAAGIALLAIMDQLGVTPSPSAQLAQFAAIPIRNTRAETVGTLRATGELSFL